MAVGDTFVMDEQDGKTVNRIDKKDTWEAVNPVLGVGEIGIEKDGMLKNIKIGDGQTAWNALGYTFKQCPYEVGDIYMTTSSVTPATRWPGTQWEVFAPGRVLIGAGTGQDSRGESKTFEIGDTGGEYQHQLTTGELASHGHSRNGYYRIIIIGLHLIVPNGHRLPTETWQTTTYHRKSNWAVTA